MGESVALVWDGCHRIRVRRFWAPAPDIWALHFRYGRGERPAAGELSERGGEPAHIDQVRKVFTRRCSSSLRWMLV
jgi:hypothetical protein